MSPYVERLVEQLRDSEDDLKNEVGEQQSRWHHRVHGGRTWFDEDLRESHKRLKVSIRAYIREGKVASLLTAPLVYSLLIPLAVLDAWVTLYQAVCFRTYRIAPVRAGTTSRSIGTSWRT